MRRKGIGAWQGSETLWEPYQLVVAIEALMHVESTEGSGFASRVRDAVLKPVVVGEALMLRSPYGSYKKGYIEDLYRLVTELLVEKEQGEKKVPLAAGEFS